MLRANLARLRAFLSRARFEADLDEELRYHLDREVERRVAAGMEPGAARAAVRRDFGRVSEHQDAVRSAWRWPWVDELISDVRFAVRGLWRAPGYAAVAILTLALGIAATTAIFTVINGVLLSPLPYPRAHELVQIERMVARQGGSASVAWPDFRDWREQAKGLTGMAAYAEVDGTFEWGAEAEALTGYRVTRDFFSVIGVDLVLGRTFDETEDTFGGSGAIILSHGLWQRRFNRDPAVLGRTLSVGGRALTIVGVAAAGFAFPAADAAFWQPLQDDQILQLVGLPTNTRSLAFLTVVARIGTTSIEGAAEELGRVATLIDREAGRTEDVGAVRVFPLIDSLVDNVRATVGFLMAAVTLVLLVACTNVAGLTLSRTAARERELAVRVSLGASRTQVFRQLFTESVILASVAGLLGSGLAVALAAALRRAAPVGLPRLEEIHPGPVVLLFSAGLTVLTGALCGLLPALRASRAEVVAGLASASRGSSASLASIRPQRVLVVTQVAVSVILLSAAALLGNSFVRLMAVDRGFDAEHVILASVQPADARYGAPDEVDGFYRNLLDRIRAMPGVRSASSTYSAPLTGNTFTTSVALEGKAEVEADVRWAGTVIIRDHYFETLGIPLLRGREFDGTDRLGSPAVAIVSEAMAKELWPGEDPLGKRFVFAGGLKGSADSFDPVFFPKEAYTVVGLAGNIRRDRLDAAPRPEYYRPHSQITWGFQFLLIRAEGALDPVMRGLREQVWAVDPTVPVKTLRTLQSQVGESVGTQRFRTLLVAGFAGLASLLAMVGLYAVMAMSVQRRVREMGTRLALGAAEAQVLGAVLRSGLVLVTVGIAVGLGVAFLGRGALAGMLFGIEPFDPLTYLGVVLLTGLVALVACFGPARRASRVDPMTSLRDG